MQRNLMYKILKNPFQFYEFSNHHEFKYTRTLIFTKTMKLNTHRIRYKVKFHMKKELLENSPFY